MKKQIKSKNNKNCDAPYYCAVGATLSVIGGKWKPIIIFKLIQNDILRFGELKKEINGVTQRMLTQQLRELESDKVVTRKVYAQVPPRVEYSLTPYGKTLEPIMIAMCNWGTEHITIQDK